MDHSFIASQTEKSLCAKCKRAFMDHTGMAECEVCGAKGLCNLVGTPQSKNILACASCERQNKEAWDKELNDPERQQARINEHNAKWTAGVLTDAQRLMRVTLEEARAIDASIEVKEDIFNAATVSIQKLKEIIDADESIERKDWELAKQVEARFKHYKQVLFQNDNARAVLNAEMRASHVYLTQLAERLTIQERDALQLKDINYKPADSKTIAKLPLSNVAKAAKKTKLDMDEVKKYCRILADEGIPVLIETLAGYCIARGVTPEQGSYDLRKSIKEAKSESTK